MSDTKVALWFAHCATLFLLVVLILMVSGHASTLDYTLTKHKSKVNIIDHSSSVVYLLGTVEAGQWIRPGDRVMLNIRIQPFAVRKTQDRSIAFCGDVGSMFKGVGVFLVLTYDSVMHQEGCFDLLGVHTASAPGQ